MRDRHPLDIYCIAIGGTGMAPLACGLKELGHQVRGADGPLYPPMSTLLARASIAPHVGYAADHLKPPPDLVVVGNAVPRSNPEAVAAEGLGVPLLSMPQALARFFLEDREPLVVAGTHGKTTTSSLAAYVYHECGADPGFLIGGMPLDLAASFRRGAGRRFVVEGDEYNAAYFDRGAKFLHYAPETVILTSAEYDHADLYPDPEAMTEAYRRLLALLPATGLLVACADSAEVRALVAHAPCRVLLYGLEPGAELRPREVVAHPGGSRVTIADEEAGEVVIELQLSGEHNVSNALAVWAVARRDRLPATAVAAAMGRFRGVRRRLEEIGRARDVVVVDDFAHHPTEVRKSLAALRQRYSPRRLIALFEPRSLTAGRRLFFASYKEALAAADRVFLAPVFHHQRLSDEERLDTGALGRALVAAGTPAVACSSLDELVSRVLAELTAGDVVVTMSSGSFEDLAHRLLASLGAEPSTRGTSRPTSAA